MARVPPPAVVGVAEKLRGGLASARRKMVPAPLAALDFVSEMWSFQVVYVLTELGVFDELKAGPRSATALASTCSVDEDMLYRLLRAGTNLDLVEERADRVFALQPVGAALCEDDPESFRDFLLFMGRVGWRFWGNLLGAVKEGTSAMEHATGTRSFEYLKSDPAAAEIFNRGMTAVSNMTVGPVVAAYDFSKARRIVDVGGGHGRLLAGVLEKATDARGVLFDLPSVVEGAGEVLRRSGAQPRVDVVAGDFFESVPEGGDVYLLKTILHDWEDDEARRILENVRRAIVPEGRALLCEAVVPGPGAKHFAKLLDVEMMVHAGGRERTREEYARLFEASGFALTRVIPTGSPLSLVEAVPAR